MSQSLFSNSWYRVAELKAKLRSHATVHRHSYRGRIWYVIQDHVTGQFNRFSPQAYQMIGLMDGERSLQQVWDLACQRLGDDMPTQDEVIRLISQLYRANVLQTDQLPDIDDLARRRRQVAKRQRMQRWKSPLSIRIPLLDPNRFLNLTMPWVSWMISGVGGLLWLLVVVTGIVLAGVNWDGLTGNLSDRVLAGENLLLIALVYPVVKVVHELGHAYAVKRWGGEVHEVGVMLLIFFPVPYVDASAASAFANKYQRMLVGAAGILTEMFLAAIAMIVWTMAEPGAVRAVAFNVMLIGGVSTVLFNGNPLLRFDAYYVLADYLEIPNFGQRANRYVGYLTKRYLYGFEREESPASDLAEKWWLAGYAVLSYLYRMVIMVAITLFVATQYFLIGSILACWSLWTTLIQPIGKLVMKPINDPQLQTRRRRVLATSIGLLATVVALLFLLPLPYSTKAEGVIAVPQQAYVRSPADGFVAGLDAEPEKFVPAGTLLVSLEEPGLEAQLKVQRAKLAEAEVRFQASVRDRAESELLREEISYLTQEVARAEERQRSLSIQSAAAGYFVIPNQHNLEGRYLHRGELIGYVVDYQQLQIAVMISDDDIDLVRNQSQQVSVRFVSDRERTYSASVSRIVPASSKTLPSRILSTDGGGVIALDPSAKQPLQAFNQYYRVDIDVPEAEFKRFDERVYVRIEHPAEPVVYRWYRAIRRVFLRQFNV